MTLPVERKKVHEVQYSVRKWSIASRTVQLEIRTYAHAGQAVYFHSEQDDIAGDLANNKAMLKYVGDISGLEALLYELREMNIVKDFHCVDSTTTPLFDNVVIEFA